MTTSTTAAQPAALPAARQAPARARLIRGRRRVVQWTFLAMLLLPPLLGWWRIDLASGAVLVAGWRVPWGDAGILAPLFFLAVTALATLAVGYGLVWCGWLCPQNTLSELVDSLISRILGRHEAVGMGEASRPHRRPANRLVRWASFTAVVAALSLAGGVLLASWFLPLPTVLAGLTGAAGAPSLYWLVGGLAALLVVDLAVLRHYWCRWLCPYSVWSFLLWGRDTLRVGFDRPREHDCVGCGACVRSCYMGVDPRQPVVSSRCINCGECVDACGSVQLKRGKTSLLEFTLTPIEGPQAPALPLEPLRPQHLLRLPSRMRFPLVAVAASLLFLVVGIAGFQPVRLAVAPEPGSVGVGGSEAYQVELTNLSPGAVTLRLEATGLPVGSARFSSPTVQLGAGSHATIELRVSGAGPRSFSILARDASGTVRASQTALVVGSLQ